MNRGLPYETKPEGRLVDAHEFVASEHGKRARFYRIELRKKRGWMGRNWLVYLWIDAYTCWHLDYGTDFSRERVARESFSEWKRDFEFVPYRPTRTIGPGGRAIELGVAT